MKIKDNTTPCEGELAEENGILKVFTKGKWVQWRGREPCPLIPTRTVDRLPHAAETDAEGRCWCASERPYPNDLVKKWELRRVRYGDNHFPEDEFWLPYNSLPSHG